MLLEKQKQANIEFLLFFINLVMQIFYKLMTFLKDNTY